MPSDLTIPLTLTVISKYSLLIASGNLRVCPVVLTGVVNTAHPAILQARAGILAMNAEDGSPQGLVGRLLIHTALTTNRLHPQQIEEFPEHSRQR